jgi:hypothetical protein
VENEDAINKTLSSLSNAVPPLGMEARIEERLQRHALALGATGLMPIAVPRQPSYSRDRSQLPGQRMRGPVLVFRRPSEGPCDKRAGGSCNVGIVGKVRMKGPFGL